MSLAGSWPSLDVIVTCTDRKTRPAPDELAVRSHPLGSLQSRMKAWTAALESSHVDAVRAEQLYAGDHWQVIRTFPAAAPAGTQVHTWVCSAGYGLIQLLTPIRPYAATFTTGHPDAVAPREAGYTASDWWHRLAEWQPEGATGPRTVAEVAAASKTGFVLVAVSGQYARALDADLAGAARAVGDPDRLAIITGGSHPADIPRRGLIPADARLKGTLGGATHSLNARIARRAIERLTDWYPSQHALASLVQSWLDVAPPAMAYDRQKLDDDSVGSFIRQSLDANPNATHTRLLRALRDSGRACEQARFAALFHDVQAAGGARVNSLLPSSAAPTRSNE